MGAQQARVIEEQQATIKRLMRRVTELERVAEAQEEVRSGDINIHLTGILNAGEPVAITRFGHREAYIVPAKLIEGRA